MTAQHTQIGTQAALLQSSAQSWTHRLALSMVALTMMGGAIVFTEPSPFDVLGLGLVILLPAVGLVKNSPLLQLYGAITLLPVGCAFFAILAATDAKKALTHTMVTLFLVAISLVISAFVMRNPERHMRLILKGTAAAGFIATTAGLAGYMGLFPGAYDIFTLYGRASGTFKDPNVFGAFLVLPAVFMLHAALSARSVAGSLAAGAGAGFLALGILLSFSRGAWFGLALSTLTYGLLAYITATTARERTRIAIGLGGLVALATVLVITALQFDAVRELMSSRATLTQSYDEGPEGRFGGQAKARALILAHPFGLGAQQFDTYYHLEEAHNVYLSMFMNAGWLGGFVFALLVASTVVAGAFRALKPGPAHHLFLVVYAAFLSHALEGFIIDLDHWRHFHLLTALCWGLILAERMQILQPALQPVRVRATAQRRLRMAHIAS